LPHFSRVIHSTAVIHPKARLDGTVQVGPFAVIDEGVELGPGCVLGPHVYLTGLTRVGARNRFFAGCVIGEAPQDLKYRGAPTSVRIGDDNIFREHVTVHRSTSPEGETVLGSRNYLMQHSHVGHNARIDNDVILASGALLGGHVHVGDRAFLSGNCAVHQFVRVGTLAIMQGGGAASKDIPPFTMIHQVNVLCGLNVVGLRRASMSADERLELKRLYKALFRSGVNLRAAAAAAREDFSSPSARCMLEFIASSKRGVCMENRGCSR
jgi:UDP-N-acetylglucosamine acyltransferase